MSDKPTFFQDLPPVSYADGWPLQLACSTLLSVDEMFASVKIELARRGRKNVLFVLLADNGMGWGDHRWPVKQVSFSTAMPLSIRWEGHDGGPRTVSDYVQNVDLAPTLAEIGGAAMGPYPNGQTAPDGKSQAALLAGGPAASRPSLLEERAAITNESGTLDEPGWYAIRTTPRHGLGLWHYIEWNDGQRELYDLATDPSELDNVADTPEHSDVQAALALQLARLKAHF